MKDEKIIEALVCCSSQEYGECKKCPKYPGEDFCSEKLHAAALDLINRQKAEIERLEKANESFSCMGKMYSEIKSEARKEFAERFKDKAEKTTWISGGQLEVKDYKMSRAELDNLLAEMESERG